jgi:aspartate 1-decarboxylase
MLIKVLKSKLAYAKVTQTELRYVGSITIDLDWIEAAGLIENEQVQVVNLNNGVRFETYVIPGERGSKIIALNGPAARLGVIDDELFVLSYGLIDPDHESITPKVVHVNE